MQETVFSALESLPSRSEEVFQDSSFSWFSSSLYLSPLPSLAHLSCMYATSLFSTYFKQYHMSYMVLNVKARDWRDFSVVKKYLTVFAEDSSSVPSIHDNNSQPPASTVPGNQRSLSGLWEHLHAHHAQHTHRGKLIDINKSYKMSMLNQLLFNEGMLM